MPDNDDYELVGAKIPMVESIGLMGPLDGTTLSQEGMEVVRLFILVLDMRTPDGHTPVLRVMISADDFEALARNVLAGLGIEVPGGATPIASVPVSRAAFGTIVNEAHYPKEPPYGDQT